MGLKPGIAGVDMQYPRTITASEMRGINRSAILELIRTESPVSRSRIARQLNISLPTVMRIVEDLMAEGLVRQREETEFTGGRRRTMLEFNCQGYVVIGVDLGGTKLYGAASDLGGRIMDQIHVPHHGTSGEASFKQLIEIVEHLLHSPEIEGLSIRGIGVGAPGITLYDEGIVTWAPSLQWREYPLKAKLAEHFSLPITVDNDVNLAALGELWFGKGHNARNLVLVSIGTGIGAGIIIDGALYRGSHQASGEVGYLLPGRQYLGRRYEGFGALESLASGTGVADRARQILDGQWTDSELEQLSAEHVFDAARQGEAWAQRVVEETVDYLAIMIASISALYDPEIIVLGGGVARSADLLIDSILARIEGALPVTPTLVASELGRKAAVMGAIVNVLHQTADYYLVRKLT